MESKQQRERIGSPIPVTITLNSIVLLSSLHGHAIPIPLPVLHLPLHMPLQLEIPLHLLPPLRPPNLLAPLARPTSARTVIKQVTQLIHVTSLGVVRKAVLQIEQNTRHHAHI